MSSDVEKQMWGKAWQFYGPSLSGILRQALESYKRTAGLDDLTRLYPSIAGHEALAMLRQELVLRWPDGYFGHSKLCVELRSRLRFHLSRHLLRRLVDDHADTPAPGAPCLK